MGPGWFGKLAVLLLPSLRGRPRGRDLAEPSKDGLPSVETWAQGTSSCHDRRAPSKDDERSVLSASECGHRNS